MPSVRRPECSRDACHQVAVYRPVLLLYSADDVEGTHPTRVPIDLPICESHAIAGVPVQALLNDELKAYLEARLRASRRKTPVWTSTQVNVERIRGPFAPFA